MITLTTYRITPYLPIGEQSEQYFKLGSSWLRDAVKGLMHQNSVHLKSQEVDTSLFHNHDETNSKNRPEYPKIIYHLTGGRFMVTGINEGAFALTKLMALYHQPVVIINKLMLTFSLLENTQQEVDLTPVPVAYQLHNYLALNAKTHKEYDAGDAARKIIMLEEAIFKHMEKDLFKYLGINLKIPEIKLLEIPDIDPKRQAYKNNHYVSFNLKFSANLLLPSYLALGNGKAFGYGILEQKTVSNS